MLDFGFCARFGLCKRLLLLPAARVGGSYFNLASSIITYYSALMSWTLKSSCFGFIEGQCALLISLVRIPAILPFLRDKKVSRCMVAQVVCAGCVVRKGAHVELRVMFCLQIQGFEKS